MLMVAPGLGNRIAWMPVISVTVTAPTNAALGDTYVIPAAATGAWKVQSQKLAEWLGSAVTSYQIACQSIFLQS